MDVKPSHTDEAGFSLIEIVIALGLFSLISLAGVVLVSSILQVRDRTEGRLEELGSLQRSLMIITSDFQQADGASISLSPAGISVNDAHSGGGGIAYALAEDKVLRTVSNGNQPIQQAVLDKVSAARWRVLLSQGGWVEAFPLPNTSSDATSDRATPIAVSVELDLDNARAGVSGTLRRVVELATRP